MTMRMMTMFMSIVMMMIAMVMVMVMKGGLVVGTEGAPHLALICSLMITIKRTFMSFMSPA